MAAERCCVLATRVSVMSRASLSLCRDRAIAISRLCLLVGLSAYCIITYQPRENSHWHPAGQQAGSHFACVTIAEEGPTAAPWGRVSKLRSAALTVAARARACSQLISPQQSEKGDCPAFAPAFCASSASLHMPAFLSRSCTTHLQLLILRRDVTAERAPVTLVFICIHSDARPTEARSAYLRLIQAAQNASG